MQSLLPVRAVFEPPYAISVPAVNAFVFADLMPRRKRSRSRDFMPEPSSDLKRQKSASVPRPGGQADPNLRVCYVPYTPACLCIAPHA